MLASATIWHRITLRRRALLKVLPFFLDLITLCVEAGLNLQGAIHQAVTKGPETPLRDELQRVLRDIRAGKPRAESLRTMATRLNEPVVTSFVAAKIPLMGTIYTKYLQWLDPKTDTFHTRLVTTGRIPVVTHVTLQMHSDAIEPDNPVSTPGPGNNGNPQNPGDPPVSTDPPPECETAGSKVLERIPRAAPDALTPHRS